MCLTSFISATNAHIKENAANDENQKYQKVDKSDGVSLIDTNFIF